ncbi:TraB/VirB10 family protein [Novosphingobium sp. LASN5T]|uniref:TraB/VirB10 family protein n=1 Tax=Novosphingobium sp. LASN5T TaxID=2491021 RepID=UPI000F5ECA30|nr:TraB/VirB10 family protein [Novosphingobium sp. LASN5T]RQW39453.1 conjugal transfer protein TraB [Novosphingobium sp. LASN5T]
MTTPEDSPQVAPPAAPRADADDATLDTSARPALLDLRAQWSRLTSDQKLRAKQFGVVSTIALLGLGLYTASSSGKKEAPKAPQASNLDMGAGLRGDSLEVKLRGDLQKILDGQTLLGDRVTAIEEGKVVPGTGAHATASGDGGDLPPAIPGEAPAYPPAPPEARNVADEIPAPPVAPSAPPAPPAPPTQRQVGAIGAATATQAPEGGAGSSPSSKKGKRTIYLPPGFMKARLLTGIDALASRDATSNPEPIIARVQAPAVLPNEVKANLAGCFVIGNATGSLAKERVEIQLVSISCVDFESHAVVDQAIKGFFVDADGKKGLSGKVVTRAGATLARSFIAGTIAGISQSVEGSFGSLSTSALGSVRSLDAGDAVKSGVAGGLSQSSDKLTDFYLDLARQAGPVVEVGAAKDVVVVIQEGLALEIKPSVGSKF